MPWRWVQRALGDVHGIGLGTWSCLNLWPWGGHTRHGTHSTHTTHTHCLQWHPRMHTGTCAALTLWPFVSGSFQALAPMGMARAGQVQQQTRRWLVLDAVVQLTPGSVCVTLPDTLSSVQATALHSSLCTGCSLGRFSSLYTVCS